MSEYQLTDTDIVIRTVDQAFIPNDPLNYDRMEYDQWVADGGVPDPYVPPPEAPLTVAPETQTLYDHENRLRLLEGQPPLSLQDMLNKLKEKAPQP